MKGTLQAAGAAPCVVCGTTGGYVAPKGRQPWRARGHCKTCYDAARWRRRFPLRRSPQFSAHPDVPPARVDLATLIPTGHAPNEGAWKVAEWRETVAYEQRRTAEWLVARAA